MTRLLVSGLALVLMLASVGCAYGRKPVMRDAVVSPSSLQPGESALITVKLNDRYGIVDSVVAVVREDTRVRLPLRDDGTLGDVEAGDDVWSLQVDVPFQAPPGDFTLDIVAFRSDGEPITVSRNDGGDVPLAATATVSIFYPEGASTYSAVPPTAPSNGGPEPAPVVEEAPAAEEEPAP